MNTVRIASSKHDNLVISDKKRSHSPHQLSLVNFLKQMVENELQRELATN